ncbi:MULTISPECIES: CopG family transcriptional regulator [unclassified Sphingomonas]|jgi:predicted transcriptional regulator|uniref:ribbon-helix-helix domain-containing protein n=1 Tax=unclassified Sphingomonas TaxID=196159 RepID=UPI000E1093F1|nr:MULTISPECIES: CopG family transcriptional regulator [unclassified Sphingomonas]AXJ96099.1 CopG family transcriptional regulator [Sphingomonas sp. FARSPH]
MRTLIDLPDRDIERLDALARQRKVSRASLIRQAVERHLNDNDANGWIRRGAGYWRNRDDIGDPIEYQRVMREDRDPV